MTSTFEKVRRAVWLLSFSLEERRQASAVQGHLFTQAGCCLALAALRWLS